MAKSNAAVEPTSPSVFEKVAAGADDFVAMLQEAASAARAERGRLEGKIAELQAKRTAEQRQLHDLQYLGVVQFIELCIKAGIDKKTLAELRADILAVTEKKE